EQRATKKGSGRKPGPFFFDKRLTSCTWLVYGGRSFSTERTPMTKADIIENVYEKVGGFSKKEAAEIGETVFDTIKETRERGEQIKISGFGNFVVRDKN